MSIGIIFCIVAIINSSVIDGKIWAELKVPVPPPSVQLLDTSSLTKIKDLIKSFRDNTETSSNTTCSFFIAERDVIFELFTQINPTEAHILKLDDVNTVKKSNFAKTISTRILIHGWLSDGQLTSDFANAYFVRGKKKVNLIAVNWQKGSNDINYFCARRRVNEVGAYVARFIDFMRNKFLMNVSTLTIVGHSLGAHISGIAGKKTTRKVGKIVGLDPAAPAFKFEEVENRLADIDASYVEAIYTCAGKLGHIELLGNANFYPNGGRFQPGCGFDFFGICAHARSYEFYIESIVTPQFFAFQCDSFENFRNGNCSAVNKVVKMGGDPGNHRGLKGVFYLRTNDAPDFGKGRQGIMDALETAEMNISMKLASLKIPK